MPGAKQVSSFFLCAAVLSGCATVVSDQLPAYLSPDGRNSGVIGKVAYNHKGLPEIVKLRKEQAYVKIVETCGGNKYEVISEKVVETDGYFSNLALIGTKNAMLVEFRCR